MCQKSKISYAHPLILWGYSQGFQNDQNFENQCTFRGCPSDIFVFVVILLISNFRHKSIGLKIIYVMPQMTWSNQIIIQNGSKFWKKKFGSKFYHQRDLHSSPDFILQLIIVIEMKWIMCLALKSILILALMTWTIEIITEKGSNFQKIKFGSILHRHRTLQSVINFIM